MMHEIESWIKDAALSGGFLAERVSDEVAADIQTQAKSKFVIDNPRAWWMSLSRPYEQFDSKKTKLSDVLPGRTGRGWLIAETEMANLPVYAIDLSQLPALLGECPYFEYYVLGSDLNWIVAESDHNVYFVCRA
jgi:hypothetical protein